MLASSEIPESYLEWNRHWGAPFGNPRSTLIPGPFRNLPGIAPLCGLFAFQTNNDTRTFEYPWACNVLGPEKGMNIVEIGGGLSGLQFVLDRMGCHVINVDPGTAARGRGWPVTPDAISSLNRQFGTRVELKNCFLEDAGIVGESHDRVFSISVIEHIPDDDILSVLAHVRRILKPGGLFVITLDLFLDVAPFTTEATNRYGKNVSARWLVENSGLTLLHGNPTELYGFPDFNAIEIHRNRNRYLIGNGYPAMVQMMVLQK